RRGADRSRSWRPGSSPTRSARSIPSSGSPRGRTSAARSWSATRPRRRRTELLERMEPFLYGGHMIRKVAYHQTTWGDLPHKFEAGTSPVAEAIGLGAAVDYLTEV